MCGIAGFVSLSDPSSQASPFGQLFGELSHRGPHGQGQWTSDVSNEGQTFHLGHHRLAIVDLSDRAAQPLAGRNGSMIVVNGEIYNAPRLRNDLKDRYEFRTTSDSEVLLAVLDLYGLQGISHVDGMFAFAYVPSDRSSLWIGRDRLGIKPLYWTRNGDSVWFSSEARPLARALRRGIDNHAFTEWARYQLQVSNRTFYEGIQSVPPAHAITIRNGHVKSRAYWSLDDHLPSNRNLTISADDAASQLGSLMANAVSSHMMSDVEVATITSGGMDSSWISAHAAKLGVTSAYVGRYDEPGHDETDFARAVTGHAILDLNIIDIGVDEYFEALTALGSLGDFPGAGPGAIGQLLVARRVAAKQRVVLAGTGGDELFLGYVRDRFPLMAMSLLKATEGIGTKDWSYVSGDIDGLAGYDPMFRKFANAGGFVSPLSGFLATIERSAHTGGPFRLDPDLSIEVEAELRSFIAPDGADSVMQIHDALLRYEVGKFLPSLLQVEDRVTMAYGLESRVPLLDLAVVEFVLGLPLNVRLGGTRPKDLMRRAAAKDLPSVVLERKDKMGFPVPLNAWARGAGKARVTAALESLAERDLEFIDSSAIRGIVNSQDLASRNLWGALSLESWLAAN